MRCRQALRLNLSEQTKCRSGAAGGTVLYRSTFPTFQYCIRRLSSCRVIRLSHWHMNAYRDDVIVAEARVVRAVIWRHSSRHGHAAGDVEVAARHSASERLGCASYVTAGAAPR